MASELKKSLLQNILSLTRTIRDVFLLYLNRLLYVCEATPSLKASASVIFSRVMYEKMIAFRCINTAAIFAPFANAKAYNELETVGMPLKAKLQRVGNTDFLFF